MMLTRLGIFVALVLSAITTAQIITSTSLAPPVPQHTAIYTTTVAKYEAIRTVVVTLLMPRDQTGFPTDGTPVTGTAISQFSAAQPDGKISTWSETEELYWTLTGNTRNRFDTNRPFRVNATTAISSSFTMDTFSSKDYYDDQGTHYHYDYTTLSRVTFVEGVGTAYPATIVREGATLFGISGIGGVVGGEKTTWGTAEMFRRATNMVQVTARPTP